MLTLYTAISTLKINKDSVYSETFSFYLNCLLISILNI